MVNRSNKSNKHEIEIDFDRYGAFPWITTGYILHKELRPGRGQESEAKNFGRKTLRRIDSENFTN